MVDGNVSGVAGASTGVDIFHQLQALFRLVTASQHTNQVLDGRSAVFQVNNPSTVFIRQQQPASTITGQSQAGGSVHRNAKEFKFQSVDLK